ncbi:MAG TPA: tetratricopeptide repeat protein [Gemmatimonadaceae bacterium]|nr:tetratricopeptide repeat protein [Gemmatimonadaceae bacterium]
MSAGRDEYKQSLFDKQGPEAIHTLRTATSLSIPIVSGAFIGGALAVRSDFSGALIVLSGLGGSLVLAVWWWFCMITIRNWTGRAFGAFIQPTGPRYERQYSHEDTLVMRGDAEGALASYEGIILEAPDDAQPRIRAADLYAKSGLRERAELLYRAVQRLPSVAARDDIYASNRLVDLYLSWPGHEAKGLRELRRLVDTYPETDVAERARAGLVNLKSQLGVTE